LGEETQQLPSHLAHKEVFTALSVLDAITNSVDADGAIVKAVAVN
jgi:hypothetical protein